MKMHRIKLVLLCFVVSTLVSCSKEDEELDTSHINFKGDTWIKGPLDTWLYENFVLPYNIEVKYRFDRYELSLNRVLVPPREDKVMLVMETIKKTWIAPYEQEAGAHFY